MTLCVEGDRLVLKDGTNKEALAIADFIDSITQVREHELFRDLGEDFGDRPPCDAEGWRPLTPAERQLLKGVAELVRRRAV